MPDTLPESEVMLGNKKNYCSTGDFTGLTHLSFVVFFFSSFCGK